LILGGVATVVLVTGCTPAYNVTEPAGQASSALPIEPSKPETSGRLADDFVRRIVGDTEDVWTHLFKYMGRRYDPPKVVLFDGATTSGCGVLSVTWGPFYCPNDRRVYLDTAFFKVSPGLARADFADAYLIVHAISHHVQNSLGTMARLESAASAQPAHQRDELRVRLELQADCYTGIWTYYVRKRGLIEPGDLAEAPAAQALSDKSTHGVAAQRLRWFNQGLAEGNPDDCDTFNVSRP
jgi:predicted metalloprotease